MFQKIRTPSAMTTLTRRFRILALCLGGGLVEAQFEPYLYTIYYNEDDCNATIANSVSLIGHCSEDDEYTVGGWDNVTNRCSIESACLINNRTDLCLNMPRTAEAPVSNSVSNDGRVFQCDGTNGEVDQGLCRYLGECYKSSAYPNCNFRLVTTSDIFENRTFLVRRLTKHSSCHATTNNSCSVILLNSRVDSK